MTIAVIDFPGSNCTRDVIEAAAQISSRPPHKVWHKDTTLDSHLPGRPGRPDLVIIPGGFSFGDYLRCGAIAAQSPIMDQVLEFSLRGGAVLGICNGFQILIEAGLLPGALIRNKNLKFVCRNVRLKAHQNGKDIMTQFLPDEEMTIPVAHNHGQFYADDETLKSIEDHGQIAFTYVPCGPREDYNPNGSMGDIAAITSKNGRILGMMPHPERKISQALGGTDGKRMLTAIIEACQA